MTIMIMWLPRGMRTAEFFISGKTMTEAREDFWEYAGQTATILEVFSSMSGSTLNFMRDWSTEDEDS